MKLNIKRLLSFAAVAVLLGSFASESALAQGASRASRKDDKKEDAANQIDQQTGAVMSKASELINANQVAQARAKLAELKLDKLSPHERAIVEQMNVQMDMTEEKYASARQHMNAAINSGGLNDKEIADGKYFIAQTFVQEEKWQDGINGIEEWLKLPNVKPNGNVYYLLAVAYYQLEKMDQALVNAKKAVDLSDKPQEGWLSLYASLLINREKYKDAIPVVEKLVNAYPAKKQYWMQLSGVFGQTDDLKNALIVMQLANDAGLLTEQNEFQRMADLMMTQDMPYSAANVVTNAIDAKKIQPDVKTWQFLSNAYIAAREWKKAVPALEKAAQMSDKGIEYMQLGQVNLQMQQWDGAVAAYEKALSKGGLKDPSDAHVGIGAALFNQKKYSEAKAAFEKVPSSNASNAKTAKSYIQAINAMLRKN